MNRNQRIIVSITGIFLVLLILVGLTYGYFLTKIKGNTNSKSISVTTANLKLVYNDGSDGVIGGELLEPSNTEYTKTFIVKNEGNKNVTYGVYLINVINTFERKEDIKYTMSCSTDGDIKCNEVTEEVTFPSGIKQLITNEIEPDKTHTYTFKFTYKDTGTDQSIDMNKELSAKIQIFGANGTGEIIPYEEGTLSYSIVNNAKTATGDKTIYQETPTTSPGNAISTYKKLTDPNTVLEVISSTMPVSSTYQAYYWIYGTGYTINESTGFTLTGVNSLSSSSKTYANMYSDLVGKYLIASYASGNSVPSTSTANPITTANLLYSIYKVTAATSSQITYKEILPQTVGVEKTLSKSEDDYGDSYYYRGKVVDNYVNFAGMCWRIVRIEGDGSVKLILEDQNTTCNSSSYTGNWNLGGANFGYDQSTYGSSKYVINYLNPVTNASSALVNKFKTFQTGALTTKINSTYNGKGLSDYLKAGDWCYDDIAYASKTSTSGTPLTEEQKINYYNGTTSGYFYYDSYIRLEGQSTRTPTNKCNGTILNKFNDNTEMYVATLTADEIAYAGGRSLYKNYGYYLLNDYQKINERYWWSLSPYYWSGSYSILFDVTDKGSLNSYAVSSSYSGSRPAVSLKSTVQISGGNGLKNTPYEIKTS